MYRQSRLPKASGWDYAAATERWQTSLHTDNSKQKTFTRVQQRWILQYDFIWFVWFCRTSWFTPSLLVVNLCAALWIQKSKESPSSQSCGIQPAARCPVLMRFTWGSHEIPHVLMSVTFCPLILFENHWKPIWSYSLLSCQPAQALPVGDLGPAQIVAPVVALYGGLWFKRCVQGDSVSFHVCIHVGWFLLPPSKGEYVSPIFEATPMYESGLQSNYRLIYQIATRIEVYVNVRMDVHQESRAIRQNVAPDVFASNPICHCTRLAAHIGTEASRKHNPVSAIFLPSFAKLIYVVLREWYSPHGIVLRCCKPWSIQNADKRSQEVLKGFE